VEKELREKLKITGIDIFIADIDPKFLERRQCKQLNKSELCRYEDRGIFAS